MASAIDIDSVKPKANGQLQAKPAEETDQVNQPLVVVVNQRGDPIGNGINNNNQYGEDNVHFSLFSGRKTVDPNHTKRMEFQNQSREACGAFCDFGKCSFHGVSSCLILYFVIRGIVNILIASVLINIHCSDNNLHKLDNALGEDFPYSCHEFHIELNLQLFDGIFGVIASLMAILGLITLRSWLLIPVIIYGIARIIYLLVLIFMFSDFVNVGAIIGVLFSILWTLVFYNTYKIV